MEIAQARQKQKAFDKEIDVLMNRIVDEGFANITTNKISKPKSKYSLRIVTEPVENEEDK